MFRKFIITVICCLSIFALSAVPSYAAGFGGGQRGGGFGSGGFSGNTIESTLSNCVFVLTSYPHGDTLHIGVCELVCFNPFCNVL